jgi:hypothetical protein
MMKTMMPNNESSSSEANNAQNTLPPKNREASPPGCTTTLTSIPCDGDAHAGEGGGCGGGGQGGERRAALGERVLEPVAERVSAVGGQAVMLAIPGKITTRVF